MSQQQQPQPPSLFHRSIAHALSSWTALAACVRAGAGGRESAEKADWLIGATETWMTENQGIEPEELADFYQDVLWNEFDTIVDDGSLIHVAKTICDYQSRIKRGQKAEVEAAIREPPKVVHNVSIAPDDDDDDDDDDNDDGDDNTPRGGGVQNGRTDATDVADDKAELMEVDGDEDGTPAAAAEEEEDDGWTTVKKGGKKKKK